MPNEHEEVDLTNNEGTEAEVQTKETTEDTVDWKAIALEEQGRRKRLETKLSKPSEPKTDKAPSTPGELDYGQKAYLVANGIKGADEIAKVKEIMSLTGKDIDGVLESKYFQAELKEMRELRATADATPTGSKRSAQSQSTTVEYWLAKGELPPASERELRQQVVNARIKREQSTSQFTNNPIVGKI